MVDLVPIMVHVDLGACQLGNVEHSDMAGTELGQWMGRGTGWATLTTLDDYKDKAAQPHTIVIITRKVSGLVNRCLRTIFTI